MKINNLKFLFSFLLVFYILGCKEKALIKPIITSKGTHIGDSLFNGKVLSKIVFIDTTYFVDSIVFYRDDKYTNNLKGISTFWKGRKVFENIIYHPNGKPKEYRFVESHNENYFYERSYDENGVMIHEEGKLFFEGHYDKIDSETLEVKDDGTRMHIQIFYPHPPDCNSFVYVDLDDTKKDILSNNLYLSYLKETWVDTEKSNKEWSLIDLGMDLICGDDTLNYKRPLYYKVVN